MGLNSPTGEHLPRVTVIIATYNWATVLPYSVGSVLDQTFTDFELLVVGDGCTDESGDVVGAITDERVQWHNLPVNAGQQAAPNNEGIRLARGSVIAYLGHDDLWLPHHLETLVAAIDDGAAIAHAATLWPGIDGVLGIGPTPGWSWAPGDWVQPTTMVHDRALAQSVGGWRMPGETGNLDPDTDLLLRMAAVAGSPRWVRRLTSVKISAARRESVYRARPYHEQATWLARIRDADDPEAELLALAEAGKAQRRRSPRSRVWRVARAVRRRIRSWISEGLIQMTGLPVRGCRGGLRGQSAPVRARRRRWCRDRRM